MQYVQTPKLWLALVLASSLAGCARGDRAPRAVGQSAALVQGEGTGDSAVADGAAGDAAAPDSGSPSGCQPVSWNDTTCDGRDDNCNGQLDEDCDFGPANCPAGSTLIEGTAGDDWLVGTPGND